MTNEERRLTSAVKRLKDLRSRVGAADRKAIDVGIEHIEARLTDRSLNTIYGEDSE